MTPKVAIIILNWNQPQLTSETLDSFFKIKASSFKWHIFLVDNHSTDNSVAFFKKKYQNNPKITLITVRDNLGFAGGNNIGLQSALESNCSHILVANNDILVKADFLEKLLDFSLKRPRALIAPKIYFAPGFEFHQDRYKAKDKGKVIWALGGKFDYQNILGSNIAIDEVDTGRYDKNPPIPDFISGCCFFSPRALFDDIGLFDPRYYLYLEDVDFSLRARAAGYELALVPNSVIWHLNSASSAPSSAIQDYFITRNRLLFASKFASPKTRFALFRESLKFLFASSYWRRQGVLDFYLKKFARGSWR